ncbi:MAG: type II toxin-antitoxin system VapC family toxin [Terracidiphilus sp.]|jgi:PIN domain nuclease of toxin-antitoxin system
MTDRLLLDSNVVVYLDQNPGRLTSHTRDRIDISPEVYVSAVTGWELSIKQANGALRLNAPVSSIVESLGFLELPITIRHGEAVRTLPLIHRDPFDRLLVAQSIVEGLTLVTSDTRLAQYGIPILRV